MSIEKDQKFPCFFHYFKIPTSGDLILESEGVHFKGIHINGETLEKTFLYKEILSVTKGKIEFFNDRNIYDKILHMYRLFRCKGIFKLIKN